MTEILCLNITKYIVLILGREKTQNICLMFCFKMSPKKILFYVSYFISEQKCSINVLSDVNEQS